MLRHSIVQKNLVLPSFLNRNVRTFTYNRYILTYCFITVKKPRQVYIDEKLHAAAGAFAKKKRTSFSGLVEELLLKAMPDFRFEEDETELEAAAREKERQRLLAEAQKLIAHANQLGSAPATNTSPAKRR